MLVVVCQLGPDVTVDPNTEVVLAWVTHRGRTIPLVEASPMLPSHRWEHYAQVPGNNVVFRLPLVQEMAGDTLGVTVALFAPERVQAGWQTAFTPEIQALCVPVSLHHAGL